MLELFDSLELPMAVLANASIYRYCPSVMDAFRARGAEVQKHNRPKHPPHCSS
jgi:allantoinase